MNFKERGITVGDLLLFIVAITIIFFIAQKFQDKKQETSLLTESQLNIYKNY
tara:strand:+ start:461 stop:616 length:156 start_codon:yes stop_codon:yes gene_type:complete